MANYINIYTKKDIYLKNGMWVTSETGELANGIRKTFYGDGSIQDETPIQNGVNNGVQTVYDPTGNVWWENTWKNNVLVKYTKVG